MNRSWRDNTLRLRDLLALLALAALWYGIIPIIGAFAVRRTWRLFRRRFDELRLAPTLDYRRANGVIPEDADFRCFGGFESISDRMLWIRSETFTVPVDLTGAKVFLLPIEGDHRLSEEEGEPRPIKWTEVSAVSEGARIFVGGRVVKKAGRVEFESAKESPLLVILYDGQERSLLMRAVRAGRQKNEYWNPITPYSIALGIFSQLMMALSFANRPAFTAAFTAALIGAFAPLLPLLPPGLLFTTLSRNAWRRGRAYRALRDLVRLPLAHLGSGMTETTLPDGSRYGLVRMSEEEFGAAGPIPILPPGASHSSAREEWFCYGILKGTTAGRRPEISEPGDPSAVYAAVAGEPERLASGYSLRARVLEISSTAALFAGVLANATLAYLVINFIRHTP